MPALLRADAARVVTQTSVARHVVRRLDAENPHLHGRYIAWTAYNRSKLANYHFALALQERFERAGARAISLMAHPGLTNSDLQSHTHVEGGAGILGSLGARGAAWIGMSTSDGALPALRAATDTQARGGTLYAPRFGTAGAAVRRPCSVRAPPPLSPRCGSSPDARRGSPSTSPPPDRQTSRTPSVPAQLARGKRARGRTGCQAAPRGRPVACAGAPRNHEPSTNRAPIG